MKYLVGEKVWNIWNTGRKAVPARTQGYLKLVTLALAHIQRKWRGTIRNEWSEYSVWWRSVLLDWVK